MVVWERRGDCFQLSRISHFGRDWMHVITRHDSVPLDHLIMTWIFFFFLDFPKV